MSKSPLAARPPARAVEHAFAAERLVPDAVAPRRWPAAFAGAAGCRDRAELRQLIAEVGARTIPPCWSAWYRCVKARFSASAAGPAAVAAAAGAHRVARAEQP